MTEQIQTLIVNRDGQFDPESSVLPPSDVEALVDNARSAVAGFVGHIGLQARMAIFDARHGTNYREIRNGLVEQKRRQEFERRIGLVATTKR